MPPPVHARLVLEQVVMQVEVQALEDAHISAIQPAQEGVEDEAKEDSCRQGAEVVVVSVCVCVGGGLGSGLITYLLT